MSGSAQNASKESKSLALLALLDSVDLKTLTVQIRRKNIPELPNPVPLERGLGDPALLVVHYRPGEGEKPIFDRDDVLVNKPDDEERVVSNQYNRRSRSGSENSRHRSSANDRKSRSYSPRSRGHGAHEDKGYSSQAWVKNDHDLKSRSHGQTRAHSRSRERERSRSPHRLRGNSRRNAYDVKKYGEKPDGGRSRRYSRSPPYEYSRSSQSPSRNDPHYYNSSRQHSVADRNKSPHDRGHLRRPPDNSGTSKASGRSPLRSSTSPGRRRRSRSPGQGRSRSPYLRRRSRSPFHGGKSRSPGVKRRSRTPGGTRIASYKGRRSKSPSYRKNIDMGHHSRSPDRYRSSRSPTDRLRPQSDKSRSPSGKHRVGDTHRGGSPSRRERSSWSPHTRDRHRRHSRSPLRLKGVFTKEDYERSKKKSKSPSRNHQPKPGKIQPGGTPEDLFMGITGYPYYGGEGYWFQPHLARPPFIPYAPGPLPRRLPPPLMYPRIPLHPEFRPRLPVYNHTKVRNAAPKPATITTTSSENPTVSTTSTSVTIEEVTTDGMEDSSNKDKDVSSAYCDKQADEETQ